MSTTPPLAPQTLDQEDSGARKSQLEMDKLEAEAKEASFWRWKLFLGSFLTPFGSVMLFLVGWYGSHATERRKQNQDLYTRAAAQLSSSDASVRLGGVISLDRYVALPEASGLAAFFSKDNDEAKTQRRREAMALLIGRLVRESDPAVLDAIKQDVLDSPDASALPLISTNKTAAVLFARAAGDYSGLSILRMKHATSFFEDDWNHETRTIVEHPGKPSTFDIHDPTITDLVIASLRTGSPFEATAHLNQRFVARNFLTNNLCPFQPLFYRQRILIMGSGFNMVTRTKPPSAEDVATALAHAMDTAATLERSSYILGELADKKWPYLAHQNLYGTAVVVGEVTPDTVKNLQSRGGFFSSPDNDDNPACVPPPDPEQKP